MYDERIERAYRAIPELPKQVASSYPYTFYRVTNYDPKEGQLCLDGSYGIGDDPHCLIDYQVLSPNRSWARRYRHIKTELLNAEVTLVRDGWCYNYRAECYSAENRHSYQSWFKDRITRQKRRDGRKIINIGLASRLAKYLEDPAVTELYLQGQNNLYKVNKEPMGSIFDWEDASVLTEPDPPSDQDKIGLTLSLAPVANLKQPFKYHDNLYYGTIARAYMSEEGLANIGTRIGLLAEICRLAKRDIHRGKETSLASWVTFFTYHYRNNGPLYYRQKPDLHGLLSNNLEISPGQVVENMGFSTQFLIDGNQARLIVTERSSDQSLYEFDAPYAASMQEFKRLVEGDDWLQIPELFPFGIRS